MNTQNHTEFANCIEPKNVLVLGASGSGKTFSYISPMIKQAVTNNKSLVVTQILGRCNELYDMLNPYLLLHGYDVKCIKAEDCSSALENLYSAMKINDIDLLAPAKTKCAFFIMLSDAFPQSGTVAAKILDALLYFLAEYADEHLDEDMIPVEFLLDEFQYIDAIPVFWKKIPTFRYRKIGISIVLQFITQLQGTYPDDWQHIAFACENIVGFRCSDPVTVNFISEYSNPHKNFKGRTAQDGYVTRTLNEDKGYPDCMNLPINKLIVLSRTKPLALYDRNVFRSITEKNK